MDLSNLEKNVNNLKNKNCTLQISRVSYTDVSNPFLTVYVPRFVNIFAVHGFINNSYVTVKFIVENLILHN